jgi:hypothetical protein
VETDREKKIIGVLSQGFEQIFPIFELKNGKTLASYTDI